VNGLLNTIRDYLFYELAGAVLGLCALLLGRKLKQKGKTMLEGKEVEGKIGSVGSYHADLDAQGNLEVMVGVKVDILAELEKLAAKSATKIDDSVVEALKKLLGRA
jgi:hypothetical protein